uniref:T cell receptor alpha variable 30 n=2 Tax=Macaca TaxID=9539 RepID=A0A5F8ATG6_MACMU
QQPVQSPQAVILQEGEDAIINCNSSKALYSVLWYRQKHGEAPIFLMILLKGGEQKSHDKIVATFNEKKQQSSLYLMASQLSYSGTYFCGAETQ